MNYDIKDVKHIYIRIRPQELEFLKEYIDIESKKEAFQNILDNALLIENTLKEDNNAFIKGNISGLNLGGIHVQTKNSNRYEVILHFTYHYESFMCKIDKFNVETIKDDFYKIIEECEDMELDVI